MMNSRAWVQQTLRFVGPPRVPRQMWTLPWAAVHYPQELAEIQAAFPPDIVEAPWFYRDAPASLLANYANDGAVYQPGVFTDEWGCRFEMIERGIIGEVKRPLVAEWRDADRVRIPTEYLSLDKARVNAFCAGTDKFVLSGMTSGAQPRPFERMQFIRGTREVMLDLVDQPREFFALLERIHEFYKALLTQWAETDVDGVWFLDDWGSQRSLLISPRMWRRIFKPLYREYVEIAHSHGKYAFMHSDGWLVEILPDLIEIGVDALNSQVFCMGWDNLKTFRGAITFWGELDRQHILPRGTLTDVRRAVREMKDALYRDGGVIAQCEFGAGARPENVREYFRAWEET